MSRAPRRRRGVFQTSPRAAGATLTCHVTAPAARRPGGSLPRGALARGAASRRLARRGGVRFRHAGGAQGCDLRVRLMRVGGMDDFRIPPSRHATTRSVLRPIHAMIRVVIMTWIGSDPTVQLRTGGGRVGASGVAPSAYRKRNSDRDGEPATHRRPAPRAPTDMVRLDAPPQLPSPATCSPPFTAKAQRPEQAGGAGASSM